MDNNLITLAIITIIFIIMSASLISSLYILKTMKKIKRDLVEGEDAGAFDSDLLKSIVKKYKEAGNGKVEDINTQAIIEKQFNRYHGGLNVAERWIKNSGSLMIIFGLLGTFTGLTIMVGRLIDTLNSNNLESVTQLTNGLKSAIGGMSVAFTTSLAGISGSIIAQITKVFINPSQMREEIMVGIEEYLDNVVSKEFIVEEVSDADAVEERFDSMFTKLSGEIEESYRKVMENSVSGLIQVAKIMEDNGRNINESVERFNDSVNRFSEDSREFSNFNLHLRDNIARMNVALSDFSESVKSKEISK